MRTAGEMSGEAAGTAVASYFAALAGGLETERTGSFTDRASRVLAETAVPDGVDAHSILRYAVSLSADLPRQPDPEARFGDPPVTLVATEEYYITALYWVEGTTDIHEHSFSGAFRVLVGSSLHAVYDFRPSASAEADFGLGQLRLLHAEHLPTGSVRRIESGHGLIHSLFHLERPSVSVLIRTYRDSWEPQLSYERPGLAYDSLVADPATKLAMLAIRHQSSWDVAAASRSAGELARTSPATAWLVLRTWFAAGEPSDSRALLDAVREAHGELTGDRMEAALEERRRQFAVVNRRRMLTSAEHRLFLAIVLNLPDWASIRRMVEEVVPGRRPEEVVGRWLRELSGPSLRGASGLRLDGGDLDELVASIESGAPGDHLSALGPRFRRYQLLSTLLR